MHSTEGIPHLVLFLQGDRNHDQPITLKTTKDILLPYEMSKYTVSIYMHKYVLAIVHASRSQRTFTRLSKVCLMVLFPQIVVQSLNTFFQLVSYVFGQTQPLLSYPGFSISLILFLICRLCLVTSHLALSTQQSLSHQYLVVTQPSVLSPYMTANISCTLF